MHKRFSLAVGGSSIERASPKVPEAPKQVPRPFYLAPLRIAPKYLASLTLLTATQKIHTEGLGNIVQLLL